MQDCDIESSLWTESAYNFEEGDQDHHHGRYSMPGGSAFDPNNNSGNNPNNRNSYSNFSFNPDTDPALRETEYQRDLAMHIEVNEDELYRHSHPDQRHHQVGHGKEHLQY